MFVYHIYVYVYKEFVFSDFLIKSPTKNVYLKYFRILCSQHKYSHPASLLLFVNHLLSYCIKFGLQLYHCDTSIIFTFYCNHSIRANILIVHITIYHLCDSRLLGLCI